jgi:hypothetical protein
LAPTVAELDRTRLQDRYRGLDMTSICDVDLREPCGRHRLPGLEPGRGVVLEGVARKEGGRTVLLNPAYTLLPAQ